MASVTVTLLGTGTSHGVPVIGCDCPVCTSADPRNKRLRCSALVETPEATVLIDCGPDFRYQALRQGVGQLDAVLLTHEHADHIGGMDDLRIFNFRTRAALPIYGEHHTLEAVRTRYSYAFNPVQKGGGVPQFDLRTIEPFEPLGLGGVEFLPVPYKHGVLDVIGFRIGGAGRFAYITDCSEMSEKSQEAIQGVEFLILNALRHKEHPTHLNFEQAIALARKLGAGTTWFIHTTHDIEYNETEKSLPEGFHLGYDGLRVAFDTG